MSMCVFCSCTLDWLALCSLPTHSGSSALYSVLSLHPYGMVTIRFELGALELAAGSPNPKLNRPPLTHTAKTGPLLYHEKNGGNVKENKNDKQGNNQPRQHPLLISNHILPEQQKGETKSKLMLYQDIY